jgi:hypothetical protein
MQYSVVKIIYYYNGHDNPFPRWIVGNKDFGAFADSEDKVIDYLIENKQNVSPDGVKFQYVDEGSGRTDFENMFRERFRSKLSVIG